MPRMADMRRGLLISLAGAAFSAAPAAAGELRAYEDCPYYVIYSDLGVDAVREAVVRMTAMAEEYSRRTQGFGGKITRKLPFYLFSTTQAYQAAGGLPGSAGTFTGDKLMAVAGQTTSARTWHVVQHEGFHQFARAVIRGNLPMWLNEGMAEYFGEGLFTGDLFVTGVIPPGRLARLKVQLEGPKLKPIREIMTIDNRAWNSAISIANYDQAWSMIHFLVNGDKGKYVGALSRFVNDISSGVGYEAAWARSFGRDLDAFEKRWRAYWLELPDNPTAELYVKADVATMTSYLARCTARRQPIAGAEDIFKAAESGPAPLSRESYIPPALVKEAAARAPKVGTWTLETPAKKNPQLVCVSKGGTKFVGTFALDGVRVRWVSVTEVTEKEAATKPAQTKPTTASPASRPTVATQPTATTRPAPVAPVQPPHSQKPGAKPAEGGGQVDPVQRALDLARAYQATGNLTQGRQVLQDALAENPSSKYADQAKKLLAELKAP